MANKIKDANQKMKENLEVSLMKKRECFNKAKKVVERLLEEDITEHLLLESVQYITQSHYQDVVEERVISKLCGYALCNNKLENIPTKKFHISAATNTIYDITERKNFCSNRCCKASTFLKEQILTSPVWLRDLEEMPQFQLLPTHDKGGKLGDKVTLDISKLTLHDEDKLSVKNQMDFVSSFALNTLQELEKAGGHCYENLFIKEQNASLVAVANSLEKISITEDENIKKANESDNNKVKQKQEKNCNENNAVISSSTKIVGKVNTEIVKEELTFGSSAVKDSMIIDSVSTDSVIAPSETANKIDSTAAPVYEPEPSKSATIEMKPCASIELQPELNSLKSISGRALEIKENVVEINKEIGHKVGTESIAKSTNYNICKVSKQGPERIEEVAYEWFTIKSAIYLFGIDIVIQKLKQQADAHETNKSHNNTELESDSQFLKMCRELEEIRQKDASNVNVELNKEMTDLELKVKAFYEGKLRIAPTVVKPENEEILKPILPDVDRYSQKSARQKIVLSRLSKVLSELLDIFGVTFQDISTHVLGLLQTFHLEAHNIMLRPNEWNLMGLLLIKMICEKDSDLKKTLSRKKSLKQFSMMLKSFQLKSDYLDVLINKLCGMQPCTK